MILVVDDEAAIAEVIGSVLQDEGYTVATAADGGAAFEILRDWNSPPCLAILDLMMPGMNGSAFLRILRNDQRRKYLPVVVLSALASGDLLKSTIELGVQAWFTKAEYTATDLLEAVDRLTLPVPPDLQPSHGPTTRRWQDVRWLNN